jgi:hypothetical protein
MADVNPGDRTAGPGGALFTGPGAVASWLSARTRRELVQDALLAGLSVLGVATLAYVFKLGLQLGGSGFDALAYWSFDPSRPYGGHPGQLIFLYAPPVALAFLPGHLLSFDAFRAVWLASQFAVLVWLGRRYALAMLLFLPISVELFNGNIHLLLAAAIVLGFRYPAAWSLVLLTKITPGVGLLWFAVRKEWRNLAIALGATAAISLASLLVVPEMWRQWLEYLASNPTVNTQMITVTVPLPLRLAAAAVIVVYGARTNRRWTVPVAAAISLPILWLNGFAVLAAIVPLWKGDMAALRRAQPAQHPA